MIQSSITGCAGCLVVIVILAMIGICGGSFAEMGRLLHSPPPTTVHVQ